eukprot:COSAG05_NODE_1867_length_3930_cov_3.096842_1_plen_46_part_00
MEISKNRQSSVMTLKTGFRGMNSVEVYSMKTAESIGTFWYLSSWI